MLYSILDVKAEAFGRIFEARKDEEAIRTFLTIITQSSSNDLVGLYPQDFALYRLADYDVITGRITPEVCPLQIICGLEAVQMLRSKNDACSESYLPCDAVKCETVASTKSLEEEADYVKD